MLLLQYKLLNNISPAYLSSIFPPTVDTRDLHSSARYTLERLNISTSFGLWLSEDGITLDTRNCDSIISFERKVKKRADIILSFFLYVLTSVKDIRQGSVYKCKKGSIE